MHFANDLIAIRSFAALESERGQIFCIQCYKIRCVYPGYILKNADIETWPKKLEALVQKDSWAFLTRKSWPLRLHNGTMHYPKWVLFITSPQRFCQNPACSTEDALTPRFEHWLLAYSRLADTASCLQETSPGVELTIRSMRVYGKNRDH